MEKFQFTHAIWYFSCGLILGFFASLLGIGGGPINVSLLMLLFSLPLKKQLFILSVQFSFHSLPNCLQLLFTTGFSRYDLKILWFVISAAVIGGLLRAKLSNVLSPEKVTIVFQSVILLVLFINLYNAYQIL